jgi:predicted acetyltransferase
MCTTVEETKAAPDAEMDIATLSAIFLGGNSVWALAAAGRIATKSPIALSSVATAFQPIEEPFTDTSF